MELDWQPGDAELLQAGTIDFYSFSYYSSGTVTTHDEVRVGDLLGHSLITPLQSFSRVLRRWAGSERAHLERQIVCNHWLPLNAKHLVRAGIGVMLTYGGLIGEEGSSDGLCFRPLSPRVEATHKVLWRKVMPTKPMQAFIDELVLLCK